MVKPRLALTMGDPAGIGPEICIHALAHAAVNAKSIPIVFGDAQVLHAAAAATGQMLVAGQVSADQWETDCRSIDRPMIVDLQRISLSDLTPGSVSGRTGRASFEYIELAIKAALAGQVAAVCTAPISKYALHQAGIHYPGHTEIFAERAPAARWCMMQYSESITCTFVTVHCGYADVPGRLSIERIVDVIELTAEGLARIRGRTPRIAVCGLNPHAGEQGLFGQGEEERLIEPAIRIAQSRGIQVEGPLPADTAFLPAKRASTDGFVCMYHDQGHIPVKALAFDSAVNTTLGLPVIRTSVDHGTALDIAWQGKANPGSLLAAIDLAVKLAGHPQGGSP
jgi:4-hydroxythreonine-4-phosphate dehydrogenase